MEWSVSDAEAGKSFVLEVEGNSLKGTVGKSGFWETFRRDMIGNIRLQSGVQKIIFRPSGKFGADHALLDLRELVLEPVVSKN